MSHSFEFNATTRSSRGKAESRRMRRLEDTIPAVIYGLKKDSVSITLAHKDILHALDHEEFYSQVLTIKVDGKAEKVVLKALQRHPFKPKVVHVDFMRISSKEKLVMNIPVHLVGEEECEGIKEGGVISHGQTEIEISCLPSDLPAHIDLDISSLKIGDVVHLNEIKLPKGVELAHTIEDEEHNHAVVAIQMPKEEEEESTAEEEAEGDATEAEASDANADEEKKEEE